MKIDQIKISKEQLEYLSGGNPIIVKYSSTENNTIGGGGYEATKCVEIILSSGGSQ